MIRIYGDFEGDSSLCRVSKGFASVFPDAAKFDLTRWGNDLDDGEPESGACGFGREIGGEQAVEFRALDAAAAAPTAKSSARGE